jgi:DNA modification methylase
MVEVFELVRRVLRPEGVLFLNLGDSYASSSTSAHHRGTANPRFNGRGQRQEAASPAENAPRIGVPPGLKAKDRIGIPHRVVFALQEAGWYWRDEVVWHKPAPMPSSVRDRTTPAHEFLFMLSKRARYHYDAAAIAEPVAESMRRRPDAMRFSSERPEVGPFRSASRRGAARKNAAAGRLVVGFQDRWDSAPPSEVRNRRSVWTVGHQPFPGAHFAVMPQRLVEPCVLAGARPGDLVLDPFAGSGTVGVVALRHGRSFLGLELNAEYAAMARRRIAGPLFAEASHGA